MLKYPVMFTKRTAETVKMNTDNNNCISVGLLVRTYSLNSVIILKGIQRL